MNLLSKKEIIICEGTIANNIKTLKKYTNSSLWRTDDNCNFLFFGGIGEKEFRITPTSPIRNSFKPCLVGIFDTDAQNRTILTVHIEAQLFVKIFLLVVLLHFILIEGFFIFAKYVLLSDITAKMIVIPILIVLISYLCMFLGYFTGKKSAMDRLYLALFHNTD